MKPKLTTINSKSDEPVDDRRYAREFGIYVTVVPIMIIGFLLVWAKALERGGSWWFIFFISLVLGCVIGERLRQRTITLIKKSREARNENGT